MQKSEENPVTERKEPSKPLKKSPNDFIFGKLLGEGSFSSVYLAKDAKSHKECAIKVCEKKFILREKKAESIQREKEVMTILSGNPSVVAPFFVHLYATFQDSERLYFVMTYGSGGELLKLLNSRETFFDTEASQFYAGEILLALRHLHKLRIVHRDLKPENILLNEHGHILLTDYGSAKILPATPQEEVKSTTEPSDTNENTSGGGDPEASKQQRTRRNSFVGTAQYVCPEILQGKYAIVGPPADLWALGCVIYQFRTGSSPFNGPNEFLIFQKIIKLEYQFPNDFDSTTRSLVSSLLALEPSERLGSQDSEPYTSIQSHEFFNGINFDELHSQTPPASVWPPVSSSNAPTIQSQLSNVPENLEPGFNPKKIAESILRSELGDLTTSYEIKSEQIKLDIELPKKSESSNDAGVVSEKTDSVSNKSPPNRCFCC